ncbi:MAG: NifU N-terminal domain-containing protein [Candidatus Actinomarina sp.]|tara:strand:- start:5 stop:208 length:204 start_codon:yes stop_codon:yes gene_type:complete
MELIDTPNPNAKKILFDPKSEDISKSLGKVEGISSVFVGPGFITITKKENFEWATITEDILNIFDKL